MRETAPGGTIPVAADARFRLIFANSRQRNGSSADIADYNAHVQAAAAAGHADIRPYADDFTAPPAPPPTRCHGFRVTS